MKYMPLLPLFGLPLCATAADDAFSRGIRAILPPAQRAEAPVDVRAQLQNAVSSSPTTTQEEPRESETTLNYTADTAPAADTSPSAHPEAYAAFKEKLKYQAEHNLYDFCPSMETMLKTTHDVFAAQAWMEQAAADGLPAAQQYVADRLLSSIRPDERQSATIKKAYQLVRQAGDAGYEPAMVNVYMCLKNGVGVTQDEKAAEKYMLKACREGGFIPRFKWLQLSGRLTQFEDRDSPAVKGEIERGNHHVVYFIALMAPSLQERIEWMQKAAKLGNAEALYHLSVYASSKNAKASYELLKEAIKRHSADAMFTLGSVLVEGKPDSSIMRETGLGHDDVNGRHLIKIASLTGSAAACFWLGRVSHDGVYGMQQDDKTAFRYFEEGARTGDLSCSTSMAAMLLGGIGVEKNARRALELLNRAANQGSPQAVLLLAYALYTGSGVPANHSKAEQLLTEAAAMNFPEAYIYLGYITTKGGDERTGLHYVNLAAVDMKGEARKLYDKLMEKGWTPEP